MKPQNPQNALFSNVKKVPRNEAPLKIRYSSCQIASMTLLIASAG